MPQCDVCGNDYDKGGSLGIMNSKFKEFRKLLQSSPIVSAPETFLGRDPKVSETPWIFEQLPSTNSAETRDALTAQRSPQVELHAEQVTDNGDGQIAVEEPKSVDQLGQSIAKLFQPAQLCKEHLAEIANATDSINRLARSAPEFFEPLKNFCDHVPRLSRSFASMRAFQDDLGVLAESFEPGKALHQQVIQLADAVRTRLTEVAASLEPVNALRVRAAELAQILEAGTELQARFSELAKAIGTAVQRSNDRTAGTVESPSLAIVNAAAPQSIDQLPGITPCGRGDSRAREA